MQSWQHADIEPILDGCQSGNRNCQRRLYELYYGYGMNICLRYATQRDAAAEILNDAFFRTLNSLHQFDRKKSFKPWFRRILINAAVDFFRKKSQLLPLLDLADAPELADDTPEYPELDLGVEEDVLPVLAQLSPAYRTVFNLYVMEEYSHREIGQLLGISESASRSNLARATAALKKILMEKMPPRAALKSEPTAGIKK